MTIYSLYKKVDKISGLHYLGMTRQDPFKYSGSGTDWKQHLKTNRTQIETTIIFQTEDKEEFKRVGRHYSRLWNIVGAMDDYGNKIWANRIPETGGGHGWKSGADNPMNNPTVRARAKASKKGKAPWNKGKKTGQTTWCKGLTKDNDARVAALAKSCSETKKKSKKSYGLNNPAADHTIYDFVHKDGSLESTTRFELCSKYGLDLSHMCMVISGRCKSVKGWRLVSPPPYKRPNKVVSP